MIRIESSRALRPLLCLAEGRLYLIKGTEARAHLSATGQKLESVYMQNRTVLSSLLAISNACNRMPIGDTRTL